MDKNIVKTAVAVLFTFVSFSVAFCQEQLTFTTYYPSPYGSYTELQLNPKASSSTTCNAGAEGTMYYDSDNDTIYMCNGVDWNQAVGSWARTGATTSISNTNGGYVGVGVTAPFVNMHVRSSANTGPLVLESQTNYDVFSVLPWSGVTYIGSGAYYKNGVWYHDSTNASSALFAITPSSGAYWFDSDNSSASWNVASNVPLWNQAGVLTGHSSRAAKNNFTPIDLNMILKRIDQLDITRWNFKSEGPGITHIGPMAEDFYEKFKTGDTDKSIAVIDSAGVSLAGIKGLYKLLRSQQQEIREMRSANDQLSSQVKALNSRIETLEKKMR